MSRRQTAAEVIAARGRQHREQADRREARDRVDLGDVQLAVAVEQEVDAREALAADRHVCVARELAGSSLAGPRVDLGVGSVSRQAGRVLRHVVVELVAGQDLARPVDLEVARLVADDADLQLAGAGEVAPRRAPGRRSGSARSSAVASGSAGVVDERRCPTELSRAGPA